MGEKGEDAGLIEALNPCFLGDFLVCILFIDFVLFCQTVGPPEILPKNWFVARSVLKIPGAVSSYSDLGHRCVN